MTLLTLLAGFIVGFLVGLTGIGGGVLMTPFLVIGLGIPPSLAIGTDLAYAALTKAVGAWQHWRQGTVDRHLVTWMAMGSVPASLVGVGLVTFIRSHSGDQVEAWLSRALAIVLFLVSLSLIWRAARRRVSRQTRDDFVPRRSRWLTVLVGALGGTAVGLTSVGSGTIMTVLLVSFYRLEAAQLVGTDIVHAALLTGAAALAHIAVGDVDFLLVGQLLLGSVPGVLLGSRLTSKLPDRLLRTGLGLLLLGSAAKLLW